MPSLNEKALLVSLSIHQWRGQVSDQKVAQEVATIHQLEQPEDSYLKKLVPTAALRGVRKAASAIRDWHHKYTLPWQDGNVRILPSTHLLEYRQGLQQRIARFEQEVETFVGKYPQWVEHARQTKKGLFDERQYPSATAVKTQFKVSTQLMPFPSVADFRLETDQDTLAAVKAKAAETLDQVMASAAQSLHDRLYERLHLLYEAIRDPKKVVKEATVESVHETIELVERLNITSDYRVELAVNAAKEQMFGVDVIKLRGNPVFRTDVARRLSQLLLVMRGN